MTIKDVRKAQKLSQGEFAAALGISVSSERAYEYGVRKPSVKVIEQIKVLYGTDLNEDATAEPVTVEEKVAEAVAVEEKAAEAAPATMEEKAEKVEEAPVKPKRSRKKKDAVVEAAAPAVEKKAVEVEKVEEAPAKPKRGRKKAAEAAPAVEEKAEKVEEDAAKPKRGRKKKDAAAEAASIDASLLQMQNDAESAVHALFTPATTVIIQSPMGGEIDVTDILAKVGPVDKVYVRVDQNAAYWVKGDESGAVSLW